MIKEKTVNGPLASVNVDGTEYWLEYRRRYYEPGVHFTWVEIEIRPGQWEELNPCFQSSPRQFNILKAKNIRQEVSDFVRHFNRDALFAKNHFLFVHIGEKTT